MYGHAITKFSRMGSLPHFLTHVLRCACFARESSAINNYGLHLLYFSTIYFDFIFPVVILLILLVRFFLNNVFFLLIFRENPQICKTFIEIYFGWIGLFFVRVRQSA